MEDEDNYYYEEEDNKFISDIDKRTQYYSMGQSQSFKCPKCGSWNTMQSAAVDWCKTCGYEEGYW